MTVVNPKSISGITSITTASGSDNLLTIHTSDANNTERLRIDSTGTTKIVTGIVTTLTATGSAKVGTGITLSPDGDVFTVGVSTFRGDFNISGSRLRVTGPSTITNNAQTIIAIDNADDNTAGLGGKIGFAAKVNETARTLAAVGGLKSIAGTGNFSGDLALYTRRNGVTNLDERVRITSEGKVGIGTTNPTTTLDVNGTVQVGSAVTISESGIEASGIGITVANINGTQIGGRRNIIINGAMEVAQRGISSTSDGYHSVDRFEMAYGGENEAPTQAQATLTSAAGPYREGHRKAFKITNGNQTGGAGTGDYLFMRTRLEAQDIATSGWDYAQTSSFITLSFWVKSSVAQTFPIRIKSEDGTSQNYSFQYTISSADTWQKVVHTFPGNSNLDFDNNTNVGLNIFWDIFRGTDFTDNSFTNNAWAAFSSSSRTKDQTSTWWTTNDATFMVTGVQLEVGPQATRFEHRTYGDELSLCQRYFQKHGYGAYIGFNFIGRKTGSNTVVGVMHGYPPMRAAATGTFDGAFKLYRVTDGDTHVSTSVSLSMINDDRFNAVKFTAECTGSFSTGNMATVFTSGSGGTYALDAEL